jgi:hypothetical protein
MLSGGLGDEGLSGAAASFSGLSLCIRPVFAFDASLKSTGRAGRLLPNHNGSVFTTQHAGKVAIS